MDDIRSFSYSVIKNFKGCAEHHLHQSSERFCFECVFLWEPAHTQEHLEVHDSWLAVIKITINIREETRGVKSGHFIRASAVAPLLSQSEIIHYLSSTLGKPHSFLHRTPSRADPTIWCRGLWLLINVRQNWCIFPLEGSTAQGEMYRYV